MKTSSMDSLDRELAEDARREDARAKVRGERLQRMADCLITRLRAGGMRLTDEQERTARLEMMTAVADEFFGNAAIDWPPAR